MSCVRQSGGRREPALRLQRLRADLKHRGSESGPLLKRQIHELADGQPPEIVGGLKDTREYVVGSVN